jgi:hypothetical protein
VLMEYLRNVRNGPFSHDTLPSTLYSARVEKA